MAQRKAAWMAVIAMTLVVGGANFVQAHEPGAKLHSPIFSGPGNYPPTVNRYTSQPPGHARFYAVDVPAYPWLENGMAVPTYNWGYFGARYRPLVVEQHSYFNNYRQWSFRPGQ